MIQDVRTLNTDSLLAIGLGMATAAPWLFLWNPKCWEDCGRKSWASALLLGLSMLFIAPAVGALVYRDDRSPQAKSPFKIAPRCLDRRFSIDLAVSFAEGSEPEAAGAYPICVAVDEHDNVFVSLQLKGEDDYSGKDLSTSAENRRQGRDGAQDGGGQSLPFPHIHALHVVAQARYQHHDSHIREPHNINFVLTHTDGFDQQTSLPAGFYHGRDVRGGGRQSAKKATSRHTANVESGIGVVALHPNAVAQDCSSGKRAGGIDGNDADSLLLGAIVAGQPIDERAFSRTRRPGHSNPQRMAGERETGRQDGRSSGCIVFHQRNGTSQGAHISVAKTGDEAVCFFQMNRLGRRNQCHAGCDHIAFEARRHRVPRVQRKVFIGVAESAQTLWNLNTCCSSRRFFRLS